MTDKDCIFCRILAGDAPATFLHRDDHCAAFLDIAPVNPGHVLVIPNAHAACLAETGAGDMGPVMEVGRRMAAALRASGLRCEGVNLFLADGEAAGQEVFHVHLHVIPRFRGDPFSLDFGAGRGFRERTELEDVGGRIRHALQRLN